MSSHEEDQLEIPETFPTFNPKHRFLNFSNVRSRGYTKSLKVAHQKRMGKMLNFPVFASSIVDWDFLNEVQPHNDQFALKAAELEQLLTVHYSGFVSRAWERLFQIREHIYIEPTYEFYSSFEF